MGFAGGTTDGPGQFDFFQGETHPNPFWNSVRSIVSKPSQEEVDCHAPKPVLINIADMDTPYSWEAPSMPLQIFQIGNVVTVNTPNELTTMSGRRVRKAITDIFKGSEMMKGKDLQVEIGGLANSYSHYVATFEEYQAQRYEAASTLYGPHTLSAYLQEFTRIGQDLVQGRASSTEAPPADLMSKQISFETPVIFADKPLFQHFGEVLTDAEGPYTAGKATVSVTYRGANPRNNLRLQGTFLTVEREGGSSGWTIVASDSNWETKFRWKSTNPPIASYSEVTVEWTIPSQTQSGTYRVCYIGDWKSGWTQQITGFKECSSGFSVVRST